MMRASRHRPVLAKPLCLHLQNCRGVKLSTTFDVGHEKFSVRV